MLRKRYGHTHDENDGEDLKFIQDEMNKVHTGRVAVIPFEAVASLLKRRRGR